MKLNLGCGQVVPDGWTNVDYALGARLARIPFFRRLNARFRFFDRDWNDAIAIHDLRRRFPWPDASADAIYCSHTLEHFTRTDGARFLAECFRVLKRGGIFRVVVPDLRAIVAQYQRGEIPADEFLDHLSVLYGAGRKGLKARLAPFVQFPHKCMYDAEALLRAVRAAGFEAAERPPFDSAIAGIEAVEQAHAVVDAVIVECVKP